MSLKKFLFIGGCKDGQLIETARELEYAHFPIESEGPARMTGPKGYDMQATVNVEVYKRVTLWQGEEPYHVMIEESQADRPIEALLKNYARGRE